MGYLNTFADELPHYIKTALLLTYLLVYVTSWFTAIKICSIIIHCWQCKWHT